MSQLESVRQNTSSFDGALEKARKKLQEMGGAGVLESVGGPEVLTATDAAVEAIGAGQPIESLEGPDLQSAWALEAIILEDLRPPYFILKDEIEIKGAYDRVDLIQSNKAMLEKHAKSVGMVDLLNHQTLPYAGTGWLIDEDIVVTNRHVANVFARVDWNGLYAFKRGAHNRDLEVRLDYVQQLDDGGIRRRAEVADVIWIAGPGEPDIAFLRVEVEPGLEPLELFTGRLDKSAPIAAIGYPAKDPRRNDPELMSRLFGDEYNVKRFSPGLATDYESNNVILLGDYTSLGGNSGSSVVSLETGKVVGLHFAGLFKETNYAVAADVVASALSRTSTLVQVGAEFEVETPTSPESEFADRRGYDPEFLGDKDLEVTLPGLGRWSDDVAPVSDDPDGILKYRHFSVIQSISRRLPLLTAVNIDGDRSKRLKRKGTWSLDGRLEREHQVGNELYRRNPLDRGHLVRRRDPGWGDTEVAQQAEIDTFHYTNSVPQHKNLNQRDWVGLEDYILHAAETRDFKVSVFTGPVYRDDDKTLKRQPGAEDIPIPEEFWKVAVMVNDATGDLSATGYVLSHGRMIRNLVEAPFVLGQYETYQVKIAQIEEETGLDFGSLKEADPMGATLEEGALFQDAARRIEGPYDLTLSREPAHV